jgi:hypothetical protein
MRSVADLLAKADADATQLVRLAGFADPPTVLS